MATHSLLTSGGRFGDYEVVRRLGKGGMGEVYLVRDAATGGEFAVKVMAERNHDARVRFAREAETAMKIRHPNLISVYEVGEDPETRLCFITMEYVTGGSVADRLASKGRLSLKEAVAVVVQIASALEAAHQAGVVHRDIKPDNILFDGAGRPRLADLGIAKVVGESSTLTSADMIVGTPAYMSPEQMMDAHRADARSDIYSLGVVFYEMLAGRRPNADASVVELLAKAIKGEELPDVRTVVPDVPAAIAGVLSRMCAAQPSARPASVREVLDLLRQAVVGVSRPPAGRIDPAPVPKIRFRWRPSAVTVATAVATAVAVGAVFLALTPPSDLTPPSGKTEATPKRPPVVRKAAKPVREVRKPVESTPSATPPPVARQPADDHIWDYRLDGFGVAITGVRPAVGDLKIPGTMTVGGEELEVTAIGERAFGGCRELASVMVPASVTHIGDEAFLGCEGLKCVVFMGDAPETGRNVFGRTRIDLLVRVAADSTGWNGHATTDLPERWPMGEPQARPIYRLKGGGFRLEESPQYCEIDVSSGPESPHYVVSWHRSAPAKGWSDRYRTDRIVLRRVAAGSGPQARDFYIGLFEVTRKQWENVMGDSPRPKADGRLPMTDVSRESMRGGPGAVAQADSFIGRLMTRAGLETLDLATAAQLKRAGCTASKTGGLRIVVDVL